MPGPSWVRRRTNRSDSYGGRFEGLSGDETFFCENSERAATIAESYDPNASYDYDTYALAELDEQYYVFNTTGCSCPSPDETWSLVFKGDRIELLEFLNRSMTPGAWISESFNEFLREVERAGVELLQPAPLPSKRYDW